MAAFFTQKPQILGHCSVSHLRVLRNLNRRGIKELVVSEIILTLAFADSVLLSYFLYYAVANFVDSTILFATTATQTS